jgi:hypothetical protein
MVSRRYQNKLGKDHEENEGLLYQKMYRIRDPEKNFIPHP